MGLILDESANIKPGKKFNTNHIDVLVDERVLGYYGEEQQLTVDYRDSMTGSGFFIKEGSTC